MNQREAAIVSAMTGVIICDWCYLWNYMEELMGRPIMLSDMDDLQETIRERAKQDYLKIQVEKEEEKVAKRA